MGTVKWGQSTDKPFPSLPPPLGAAQPRATEHRLYKWNLVVDMEPNLLTKTVLRNQDQGSSLSQSTWSFHPQHI